MKRRVVITGLGVITPIGIGKDAFWEAVKEGRSGIRRIESFDTSDLKVKIGGEIRNTEFDPLNWIDKKKIRHSGRETQFAIAAAQMALKDANLEDIRKLDPHRIGVIIGAGGGGLGFGEDQYKTYLEKGPERVSPYLSVVIFAGAISSEVSINLGVKGPSFTISTGCTAGADAIGYSFNKIRNGEVDLMVTGGTEAPMRPLVIISFQAIRALSTRNDEPEKASRPFDRERDGFVLSEGAGILILEELEHALKRGAPIYAEVVGYGVSGDAYHMTSPSPDGTQAARAIKLALQDANLNIEDVDYISAHGSSTPLGDKIETKVLKQVFGDYAYKLPINSIKSMIGHSIGATGAIELIASVLEMQNNFIHPTINLENPDPECDLDYVPNVGRESNIKVAVSNSFGFGGKNTVLIIRDVDI
ncbi:MAG: beta-ketoacyl-ACP synthase II [bacterium]|nr:beta-ketoacyl-ACP synthase II [bacterium]